MAMSLTREQQGQLLRDERIKTERQQRDLGSKENIQELQNQGTLQNTLQQGMNQLKDTELGGKNQLMNTMAQRGTTMMSELAANARQHSSNRSAAELEKIRQEGENTRLTKKAEGELVRLNTTGTQKTQEDHRKLAADLLLNGRGGQPVEDLYNNQGTHGYQPKISGIEPPPQRSEQPQAGTFKNIDVTDGSADSARTMLLDTRTGNMVQPPAPGQSQAAPGGGDGAEESMPLPADPGKRQKGVVYTNARGQRAVWDGQGLILAQ